MRRGTRSATVRNRRRFARRQWRRRWLAWKPLLALVLATAFGVGGVWVVYFSSVLALEDVEVTGQRTVSEEQVLTAADVTEGRPLARVDIAGVRARVASLGPVRDVDVRRTWPHGLVIEISERVPVAVVDIGGTLRSLDASGVVFGSYDKAPANVPRVETVEGTSSAALREAATVVAAVPPTVARRVDYIEVATVDQISLVLRDGRRVVWGSADDSATKAEVLAVLLEQQAQVYDVSVPGRPTTAQQ